MSKKTFILVLIILVFTGSLLIAFLKTGLSQSLWRGNNRTEDFIQHLQRINDKEFSSQYQRQPTTSPQGKDIADTNSSEFSSKSPSNTNQSISDQEVIQKSASSSELIKLTERGTISVKELADHPERYTGQRVQVAGRLENVGKDYFRNLRVILKDSSGNFVDVRPWLPSELPSAPSGVVKTPATMSDYLGKQVEITGKLERIIGGEGGERYLLVVESAQVL